MVAVNALCQSAVWLEKGRQKMIGSAAEIVSRYLTAGVSSGAETRVAVGIEADSTQNFIC